MADQLYLDLKLIMASPASFGTASALQVHPPPKQLVLGVARTDKSNVIYIYVNTIWVQDQAFTSWKEAWEWIQEIQDKVTRYRCAVDLTSQLIENLNVQSRTAIEVDKLLNKDCDHLEISQEEKKTLCKGLWPYVKAGKASSKRCVSCLKRIEQTWSIADRNRFSRLHYPRSSETFFRFVTMVVMCTPTPSCRQKAIKKLNNIVVARLTTKRRPNILSDTWRFDTSANWKMLGEEFETWPADPFPDATLITVGMHITHLSYLEDRPPRFTELPDSGTEESNRMLVGLDTAGVISETDDQDLPDLIDSEAERANKKKEKAERCR